MDSSFTACKIVCLATVLLIVAAGVLCDELAIGQEVANRTGGPITSSLAAHNSQKLARTHVPDGKRRPSTNRGLRSRGSSPKRNQSDQTLAASRVTTAGQGDISEEVQLIEQQQHMRKLLGYNNTPPLFVTNTRDFFVDVTRFLPGSKLTTIQAIDNEGDRIKYSLQPSNKPDAMPYFAINSTTGELRLSQKRFPSIVSEDDHTKSKQTNLETSDISRDIHNEDDNDDDYSEGDGNFSESRTSSSSRISDYTSTTTSSDSDDPSFMVSTASNWIRDLYFLNVGADDGEHTNVLELQIHVINSTAGLPVQLTPENGRRAGEEIERLVRTKALEYYKTQIGTSSFGSSMGNTTALSPSYMNPSIVKPVEYLARDNERIPDKGSHLITPKRSHSTPEGPSIVVATQEPYTDLHTQTQVRNLKGSLGNQGQIVEHPRQGVLMHTTNSLRDGYHAESAPSLLAPGTAGGNGNATQPMFVHMAIVCLSCLLITLVLVMFTVPLYVKRLRKRLKHIELQHEHLSQHPSSSSSASSHMGSSTDGQCVAGLSTVCSASTAGSLMTTPSGRHHLPSSLSQFTLNGSDRLSTMHSAGVNLCEQHPEGCVHSNHQHLHHQHPLQHQTRNQQQQYYAGESGQTLGRNLSICRQSSLESTTTTSPPANNQIIMAGVPSMAQATPIFNRVNNGSIANPVYLHQHAQRLFGQEAIVMQTDRANINQYVGDQKMNTRMQNHMTMNNDIYYPLEDDFYSTINTESTTLANNSPQQQSNGNSGMFCSTIIGSAQPHDLKRSNDIVNIFDNDESNVTIVSTHTKNPNSENRYTNSPTGSACSRSSTKSLVDFLTLPSKRRSNQSHQMRESSNSFVNELDQQLGKSFSELRQACPDPEEGRMLPLSAASKTIARAAQVHREQQVRSSKSSSNDIKNWEVERHRLRFLDILDEGQFGLVWRCILKVSQDEETTVAVKTLKKSAARDEREREDLLAEIEIMKLTCDHPNVVKILHCCTLDTINQSTSTSVPLTQPRPILLVMEYVELGKLQSFLLKSRTNHHYATTAQTRPSIYDNLDNETASDVYSVDDDQHLTSRDLVKFIYHVAKGMDYISKKCIVHRDLATRNILVSSGRICKIGDFGMARHMQSLGGVYERRSKNAKIPVRWMAPEVLLNNRFTTKSDVFSFGITMWEIVTLGSTPYRHLKTERVIEAVARQGERPKRPDYCHEQLYEIMSRCWSHNPDVRPTFGQLVRHLDELLMSANDYIQLDQYPDHNYCNIPKNAAPNELL